MESRDPNPAPFLPGNDWHGRLFQLAPDALLVTRLQDGHIVDMNLRFIEIMGYPREELIGRTPLELEFWVYPEDREVLMTLLRKGGGQCSGFETTMRNKLGSQIPVLMSARVAEIQGESYVVSQSREDSERRQIRKALQESEKKFREMVEFLPVMVYEADREGRLTFANRLAFSFFGYTVEDFEKGLNVLDMIGAEDRERAGINLLKTMRGEKTGEMEYQVLKKDGSRFPALIATAPIRRENRPIGIRGVVTDITGLRRVEEGLKESEEKYRMVVELSDDGIAWTQGDHHIFVNRKMAEIFGYDRPEELVGQSVAEVTHPEDRDRVMQIHSSRLRGEIAPTRYEYKGIKKNGEEVDIEVSAIRTFYQGEWGSLAFLRDITDRKKAEKELGESRELYQTLVEMSSDAIVMMKGGIHHYANPRMLEIFGYSHPNEIIGHSLVKMIHPDDRERVQEINRKRQEGKPVPAKYVFKGIRQDGQIIFLETSARRLRYRGENVSLVFLRDITDRVQAEEELKASEEKYRLVVEHANEAIFIAQEGLLRLVNPKALEITGYDQETLQTKPFLELIHPEDRAMVVDRHLRRTRGEDLPPVYSFRFIDREGQVKWVEINAVRIAWEGRPATLNFLSDITDRRLAEEALRESEERTRLIFNTVPDSITITRVEDGRYMQVNDYFCQLTGYAREETIGRTVDDLNVFVNASDRERLVQELRDKGEANDLEIQYRKKDGSLFTSLLSARPIQYAGEDCLVAVVTDSTSRKQIEDALRKSEEKYRLLVENANEAILVIQEGLIKYANPKAVKIIRYSEGDLFPQPFLKFIHPEDREKVMAQYLKRMSGQMTSPVYSFRLLDHQGNILWVEINAVQISWEGQPAVLVFLTDISEKKQLEIQFLQAQKMEAVGRLAGGVAHDFNNLLTSILGYSDLMMMRLRSGDPLIGDVKEIIKAAKRATGLTRQLLAFSRKQIMQPKVLNLNGIISDMKKMLKRLIGEDITLETLLSPNLRQVLVDPGQIDQVIMNLVINARDAMPQGGTLTIETANTRIDEVQVRQYLGAKPGAYVLLSVKDSGSGISDEIQSHIFEPFFTTKELGQGTGLGLSTVYGIVKQSNGYIWVDSRPGQGTVFKIFLPQQEGEAESDLKPERGKASLRGEETILLAEDNESVRGLTRSVLEHFGYRVLETEDGEEAGRMSKGYEGPIHLLLTDVVMPGISGRVLAEQLQTSRPGIKILFMSGYSEEAVLLKGMQNLGAHFLQKPFTPEELGLRVREILDSA